MEQKKLMILSTALILLAACEKEERDEVNLFASQDNARAENIFNDLLNMVEEEADENPDLRTSNDQGIQPGLRGTSASCADTITLDLNSTPWVLTIDFGPNNCTGADGHQRRGKVIATFSGPYRDPGTVYTVTTEDFYHDDWKVDGLKTVTNEGENGNGDLWFSVEVDDVEVVHPNNDYTLSWESSRTRVWTEGVGTWSPWDDVYFIEGTADGVDRLGDTYEIEITNPLRVNVGCPWVVQGNLELRPQNISTFYVNYGSGNCDSQATVDFEGQTYTVYMQ